MRFIENLAAGLELEFEGVSATRSLDYLEGANLLDFWETHTDGSLRPKDRNTEFVFRRPLCSEQIVQAVNGLAPIMAGSAYKLSWRCGMHVHIDHRKATMGDIIKEATLGCLLDRVWYGWDNVGRHESKFCVPLSQVWRDMVDHKGVIGDSRLRAFKYTGLNVSRAYSPDIGTVEYRYAAGTKDPEHIIEFIGMAMHTSTARAHFNTAMDIVVSFVEAGTYENWFAKYMPEDTHAAWERGTSKMLGPHYPSALELEAACGIADSAGARADEPLFKEGLRARRMRVEEGVLRVNAEEQENEAEEERQMIAEMLWEIEQRRREDNLLEEQV